MPAPDPHSPPTKLSPLKWLGGFTLFILFIVGAAAGLWLSGGHRRPLPPTVAPVNVPVEAFIFFAIFGCFFVLCGGLLYGLMLLTNAFTLSYARPFLTAYKIKQWLGNLLVGLLIQSGLAVMMAPALMSVLLPWLPPYLAGMIPGRKSEARNPKSESMTNDETAMTNSGHARVGHSGFVIDSSFWFRVSGFAGTVILVSGFGSRGPAPSPPTSAPSPSSSATSTPRTSSAASASTPRAAGP